MTERRPIAAAPRDGTRIRLFHERDAQETELCPVYGSWCERDARWVMCSLFVVERGGLLFGSSVPTHWCPAEPVERVA